MKTAPLTGFLTQEEQLLIILARQKLTIEDIEKIRRIAQNHINWDTLIKLSSLHGILPVLSDHFHSLLKTLGKEINIPPDVKIKADIAKALGKTKIRAFDNELQRISNIFKNNKIKFVVLKGPAMLKHAYKSEGIRPFGDLDLLFQTEDIIPAHYLLIESGYTCDRQNMRSAEEVLNRESKFDSHMFAYDKNSFRIEMHHTYKYNLLKEIFNNPYKLKNNILIPSLIDSLIYSCQHAWTHYALLQNLKDLSNHCAMTLRHLMDIRELYMSIVSHNKLNELYERIEALDVYDLVSNMISLTEEIYGKFTRNRLQPNNRHDFHWKSRYYTSRLEHRLFRPQIEHDRIIKLYKEAKAKNLIGYELICKKVSLKQHTSLLDNDIWNQACKYKMDTKQPDKRMFWNSYVFSSAFFMNKDIIAEFSIVWDYEYFYIKMHIEDEILPHHHIDKNYYYHNIIFGFLKNGANGGEEPIRIMVHSKAEDDQGILPAPDYNVEVYNCSSMEVCHNCKISKHITENGCDIALAVPWRFIGITPENGVKFHFNFSMTIKQGFKQQSIIWPSGNAAGALDCSQLYSLVIIS